jgi:hypothetical protein
VNVANQQRMGHLISMGQFDPAPDGPPGGR